MSTNESAPKREQLLVKLDDLQNYNNADHAKRDAFRREFAKRAFGPSERVDEEGKTLSEDGLVDKLEANLKQSSDKTLEQRQALYDSASESRLAPHNIAARRQQKFNDDIARHTADTPPAATSVSNPADATAAPELDANGHAGFTDTNDERAGVGARAWAARTNATANVGGYFARRRAALDQKYAEQRERVAHLPENEREKQLNKINRNEKIRRFAGRAGLFLAGAATATGLYLGARYGLGLIGGGNHEQAQEAATGSGSGTPDAHKGHPSTNAADHADQLRIHDAQEFFNTGLDTTKLPGKNHINDFGTPSGHGFEGNKEGMMSDWSTLLRGNSRTMSTYLSEFDMGGVRGKPSAAELSDPAVLAQYEQDLENHAKWLDANPVEHKRIYDELMATLGSAKIGELETYPGTYGSWYVDHETGRAMWDSVVNYDDVQYRTITLADGREYNINPDCFLQISEANAVVTPQGGGYNQTPQGGGYHNYVPEKPVYPEGDGNPPGTPGEPGEPGTPGEPGEPEEPGTPGEPGEPEEPTGGDDGKGNAHPGHDQLTTDLGAGEFMPEPVDVEEIVETITGRDLGGGRSELPVIDIVTNGQGIQTGGRDHAPGVTGNILDTGGNAGAGTGIEVESGAGTGETQTGTVTSR